MFRRAVIATLLAACGGGGGGEMIDAPVSAACMEATTYQDITNIENKIFATSCIFSGCHNGAATPQGKVDMRAGMSHASMVDVASVVQPDGRKLVVAGDPAKSYLLVMIGEIKPADADPPTTDPPSSIGFMPQGTGGQLLCPEKRGAIRRWIMAGAPAN